MSEPTPALSLDALERANASYWRQRDLKGVVAGTGPLGADESFEIPDLTDEEWDDFVRAIRE